MGKVKPYIRKYWIAILVVLIGIVLYMFSGEIMRKDGTIDNNIWVYDETGDLTLSTTNRIKRLNEEVFPNLDIKPEVAVEVLETIPIGSFSMDLYKNKQFNELGIGSSEHDSGLLYVIAIKDREFGIETGYGIEHIIPDLSTRRMLNKTKTNMEKYSETKEAKYLNMAVNDVIDDIEEHYNLYDTGEIGTYLQEQTDNDRTHYRTNLKLLAILFFMPAIFAIIGFIFEIIKATFVWLRGGKFELDLRVKYEDEDDDDFKGSGSSGTRKGSSRRRSRRSRSRSSFGGGRSGGGGSSGGW